MIDDSKQDAEKRMVKSVGALSHAFNKIRTGRAHPSLLDGLTVSYYGVETPLSQIGNVNVLDARTLSISVWEKDLIPEVEKAVHRSDLGLNPSTTGELIRMAMPQLTE